MYIYILWNTVPTFSAALVYIYDYKYVLPMQGLSLVLPLHKTSDQGNMWKPQKNKRSQGPTKSILVSSFGGYIKYWNLLTNRLFWDAIDDLKLMVHNSFIQDDYLSIRRGCCKGYKPYMSLHCKKNEYGWGSPNLFLQIYIDLDMGVVNSSDLASSWTHAYKFISTWHRFPYDCSPC